MLLEKNKSCFLLVDVQEKVTPHVMQSEKLVRACDWLMRLGVKLNVPILISEQYPKGLGKTVSPLNDYTQIHNCFEKIHFSCGSDQHFMNTWKKINRPQVVIAGIEAHVCVLQTAVELKQGGADVFVVADAVSSRHEVDFHYGLDRMNQVGIHLITKEMVFFEWLRKAGTSEFKGLSKEFLQ